MLKMIFSFALLFLVEVLTAQAYQLLNWGDIPADDLAMQVYEKDTTAQAVVLASEGQVNFFYDRAYSRRWRLQKHRRVKILHEGAIENYATVEIYYYHELEIDDIDYIWARTVLPDGTIYLVADEEMYREKVNEYWSVVRFTFPQVGVGSIVEYRYEHNSRRWSNPPKWTFREEVPVRSSYFSHDGRGSGGYEIGMKGAERMQVEYPTDTSRLFILGEMNLTVFDHAFWMKNGQAIKEEPFMTTKEDYFIDVRMKLGKIDRSNRELSTSQDWRELTKTLLNRSDVGIAFQNKQQCREILQAAKAQIGETSQGVALVREIANFLHQRMPWSGERGIYTDRKLNEAFELSLANLAELQYAGIALLRSFDIEANPVLISTRDNGSLFTAFPYLNQFNYVVILAEVEGRQMLLDFSDPYLSLGNIQVQALNRQGLLLTTDNPGIINLEMPIFQDVLNFSGQINPDGTIDGELVHTMVAYSARNDRELMNEEEAEDIWRDRLPEGAQLTGLTVENEEDVDQPLGIKAQLHLADAGFVNEDYIYVSPLVYSSFSENPFVSETRCFPVDFPYPFEEVITYNYTIPVGYSVESLPESMSIVLPAGAAVFQFVAKQKENTIVVRFFMKIENTYFSPDEYKALKHIFDTAAHTMQSQIVLRKS